MFKVVEGFEIKPYVCLSWGYHLEKVKYFDENGVLRVSEPSTVLDKLDLLYYHEDKGYWTNQSYRRVTGVATKAFREVVDSAQDGMTYEQFVNACLSKEHKIDGKVSVDSLIGRIEEPEVYRNEVGTIDNVRVQVMLCWHDKPITEKKKVIEENFTYIYKKVMKSLIDSPKASRHGIPLKRLRLNKVLITCDSVLDISFKLAEV